MWKVCQKQRERKWFSAEGRKETKQNWTIIWQMKNQIELNKCFSGFLFCFVLRISLHGDMEVRTMEVSIKQRGTSKYTSHVILD